MKAGGEEEDGYDDDERHPGRKQSSFGVGLSASRAGPGERGAAGALLHCASRVLERPLTIAKQCAPAGAVARNTLVSYKSKISFFWTIIANLLA